MLAMVKNGFVVKAIEDMHSKYVPDMLFAREGKMGAIELKLLDTAPKTLNDIKHYTKGQEQWLVDFGNKNGHTCFLIVAIEQTGKCFIFRSSVLKKARKVPFGEFASSVCWGIDGTASMMSIIV